MSPFLDGTADGDMHIKSNGLVFGLLDAMPQPQLRYAQIGTGHRLFAGQHFVGEDGGQVLTCNGARQASACRQFAACPRNPVTLQSN